MLADHDFFTPTRKIEPAPTASLYVWLDRPLRMVRPAESLRETSWDVVHLRDEEFISRAIESPHQHYPEARRFCEPR